MAFEPYVVYYIYITTVFGIQPWPQVIYALPPSGVGRDLFG